MVAAKAALHGIGEPQQKALVAPRQHLETHITVGGKLCGITSDVHGRGVACRGKLRLQQTLVAKNVGHARHGRRQRLLRHLRLRVNGLLLEREVKEAVGIVIGGAKNLPAGEILECGGDASANGHGARIHRLRRTKTRQGRAIGAHQESRLDRVALRLLQGERGQILIIERALVHDAGDGQLHLLADLACLQFWRCGVATTLLRDQVMGRSDCGLAPFDSHIHQCASSSSIVERGSPTIRVPATKSTSTPRGNSS